MTHEVLVLGVERGYATVNRPRVDCATCTGEVCAPKHTTTRAIVPEEVHVEVDDWVEISYSTAAATVDALVILGTPLLGFVAGYLLAPVVGAAAGSATVGEAVRAVAGLIGLAVGAGAPFLRKRLRPDSGLPNVTRVVRRRPRSNRTFRQTPDRSPA